MFTDLHVFDCPICNTRIKVSSSNFINDLPSNLYIDSLLSLVGIKETRSSRITPPSTPNAGVSSVDLFAAGARCSTCQSMCDNTDVTCCRHCKLVGFITELYFIFCVSSKIFNILLQTFLSFFITD